MEAHMSKLKTRRKPMINLNSRSEILHAVKVEECQGAIFKVLKELVERHGKEIVRESLEWFTDKLRTKADEMDKC